MICSCPSLAFFPVVCSSFIRQKTRKKIATENIYFVTKMTKIQLKISKFYMTGTNMSFLVGS